MRVYVLLVLVLASCVGAAAQQMQQPQPITVVTDYWARAGREADFLELIRTVGAPVRDKLMADGVILGWGVDVPYMSMPGSPTHSIWYDVADWAGVEKVQAAMAARLAQLDDEDKKAADEARKKNMKPAKPLRERIQEIVDMEKTRTWFFRNLEVTAGSPPPAGAMPFTRIYSVKARPGMAQEWRENFDKYIKPTLDSLAKSGAIFAWGLGQEEVKTEGSFTHFVWVSYPNLAAFDRQRTAFGAKGAERSAETNDHIAQAFLKTSDPDAARSMILRAVIFKMAPPK